jgi:hypothetical protein
VPSLSNRTHCSICEGLFNQENQINEQCFPFVAKKEDKDDKSRVSSIIIQVKPKRVVSDNSNSVEEDE